MSERWILVESDAAGLRAALVIGRRLEAVEIDQTAKPSPVGSVVTAKVGHTKTGLGTFVRLPDGSEALLDGGRGKERAEAGQSITVKIVHAPRGEKLGVATRAVALAGRGVVHLPFDSGVHLSRRLDIDADRRAALEALVMDKPGGWIFRRSAVELNHDDMAAEIAALLDEGQALRSGGALPAPDAFRRLASDYGTPDRVLVAGPAARRTVERWCARFAPDLISRIAPVESGLFDQHDLDEAIAALAEPRAALPDGGWIGIEHTAALTAVDVNSGAATNLLSVNLTAAAEIARQLRLRHIGGLVVIDFVSMARPADRDRTVAALKAAVADDPAQTHILPMSAFGLVEMTRERRGPGLEFDT